MEQKEGYGLLYVRIAEQLRSEIEGGTLSGGDQLPGVRELAARFETSGKTISRALDELETSGFIERTQGKGIFVTSEAAQGIRDLSPWGCICPGNEDFAADTLVTALEEEIGRSGRELLIRRFDPERESIADLVEGIKEKAVRGIFLVSSNLPSDISSNSPVPLVCLGAWRKDIPACHSLTWDIAGGIEACIDHLVNNGHIDIGFIGTGRDSGKSSGYRCFKNALVKRGLNFDPLKCDSFTGKDGDGFSIMKRLIDRAPGFTALVCMHDNLASGAMRAAEDSGIGVPEDICITGWGGTELGSATVPDLTTLHYDPVVMASAALGCMERILSNQSSGPPMQLLFPLELVVRGSSVNKPDDSDDRWV